MNMILCLDSDFHGTVNIYKFAFALTNKTMIFFIKVWVNVIP